jgi:predicted  nucleic acid-binding Zn-ribbon protein
MSITAASERKIAGLDEWKIGDQSLKVSSDDIIEIVCTAWGVDRETYYRITGEVCNLKQIALGKIARLQRLEHEIGILRGRIEESSKRDSMIDECASEFERLKGHLEAMEAYLTKCDSDVAETMKAKQKISEDFRQANTRFNQRKGKDRSKVAEKVRTLQREKSSIFDRCQKVQSEAERVRKEVEDSRVQLSGLERQMEKNKGKSTGISEDDRRRVEIAEANWERTNQEIAGIQTEVDRLIDEFVAAHIDSNDREMQTSVRAYLREIRLD